MTPREIEASDRRMMLKDFMETNYQWYGSVLIFKPVRAAANFLESEFMDEANRIWLIKNNIDTEITL